MQHGFPGVSVSVTEPKNGPTGCYFLLFFPEKATVREFKSRPLGPSHVQQRL